VFNTLQSVFHRLISTWYSRAESQEPSLELWSVTSYMFGWRLAVLVTQ